MRAPARRRLLVAVVALATAVALVPASAQESLTERLRENREQTESTEQELARTREEIAAVAAQIRDSESRLAVIEAELAVLRVREAEAADAAERARARTQEATDELVVLTGELTETEAALEDSRQRLDDRAARAYMTGQVDYAAALLGAADVPSLLTTAYMVERVLEADKGVVEDVTGAALDLERLRATADDRREEVAALQALVDDRARELVALTQSAEQLAVDAESERRRQTSLFARLEDKEAATQAQLVELEAQSDELEAELRSSRWRAGAPGDGTFVWPSDGRISSNYGYRTHPIYGTSRLHTGVDIAGGFGVPVVAANDGLVVSAYCSPGGYGCRVVLDHGGGIASLYAHLSSFTVAEGDVVVAGDQVALTGSTGASTGPHLHFEIRENGTPVDPMSYY